MVLKRKGMKGLALRGKLLDMIHVASKVLVIGRQTDNVAECLYR